MKLIEFSHKAGDWEINNLVLGDLNLIVGENATGKSKTLSAISDLCDFILKNNFSFANRNYKWSAKFLTPEGSILKYEIDIINKKVNKEILIIGKNILIEREGNRAIVSSLASNSSIEISPPSQELVINIRRDIEEYPEFEYLINWSDLSKDYNFCSYSYLQNHTLFTGLFETLNEEQRLQVISICKKIGFDVMKIKPSKNNILPYFKHLELREQGVKKDIIFSALSQGMSRAISLIIFFEFQIESLSNRTPTLIIDDLGEGLDYQKAINLGKYVFERCKEANIQLIAATNDNFLMDVIDLDFWNILTRKGSKVSTINKTSHPKIFEDFMFTGLSNFDLLTSEFLARKLKEHNPA